MNLTKSNTMKLKALALAVVLSVPALHSVGAEARERQRAGTWQTNQGGSGSWQGSVLRERGSVSRESSWQNANGRSGSAMLNRERDLAAGTWSSAREVTRSNGDTASWHKSGQKTETGAVVHGEGTNFRGQAVTMDRTLTHNDDGSRAIETIRTNEFNGKSLTSDKTVTPTHSGWSSSGSYSSSTGKSGTTAGSLTRTDSGYARSQSATNSEGQTASRDVAVTRAEGSATRNVTTTGFNGEKRSHEVTLTPIHAP